MGISIAPYVCRCYTTFVLAFWARSMPLLSFYWAIDDTHKSLHIYADELPDQYL